MATPHNKANPGDFAKTVLMPGDPLRAKMIADTYLSNVRLVNDVRGMLGYTGTYNGKPVSVMGSGMGMPSVGIYSYELYSLYGVENIIRIGSAGSYVGELNVGDVVLADSAYSESSFAKVQNGDPSEIQYPSASLNEKIRAAAKTLGIPMTESRIHSSDVFYQDGDPDYWKKLVADHGVTCVEMESFALFHNAKALGKKAACLLTISDSFVSHQEMSAEDRQNSLHDMIRIALTCAASED